jgi:NAD(P)-dependent dehydrogenase (short-subunit alcohol dehydrogenase family)
MPTVLVTGCSSGFGQEIARFFLQRDWSVIATMRQPREDGLERSDRLQVLALDVRDPDSIERAVAEAGPIDVLVNNAGIGWLNALEGTPMTEVHDLFATNTLGLIAMTRAVLPQMRERRAGVIVNVSSSVTLKPLRLLSVYTASKAAVNGFTTSLALELQPFGLRAHVVLPGRAPDTRFGENAQARISDGFPQAYAAQAREVFDGWQDSGPVTRSSDVVEAVWRASIDPSCPVVLPAGADATELAVGR